MVIGIDHSCNLIDTVRPYFLMVIENPCISLSVGVLVYLEDTYQSVNHQLLMVSSYSQLLISYFSQGELLTRGGEGDTSPCVFPTYVSWSLEKKLSPSPTFP